MPLLCVTSPKGGVGKTTLAANLAAALAASGRRVIVVDLDPQNTLGLHFGMDIGHADGFVAGLRNGATAWRRVIARGPAGLSYLPYGETTLEDANALSAALAANPRLLTGPLHEMLDGDTVVVVDAPPGPSAAVPILLPLVDLLLVVLLVDATSIAQIPAVDGGRAYGTEAPARPGKIGYVFNQCDLRTRLGRASIEAVSGHLKERLVGVVDRDQVVAEAIASQKLITAYAPASKAARDIAVLAGAIGPMLARAPARSTEPVPA